MSKEKRKVGTDGELYSLDFPVEIPTIQKNPVHLVRMNLEASMISSLKISNSFFNFSGASLAITVAFCSFPINFLSIRSLRRFNVACSNASDLSKAFIICILLSYKVQF